MSTVVERFLRYARIDTRSNRDSTSCPSTEKQFNLARLLKEELEVLGLQDVCLDEHAYVTAVLPGNVNGRVPVIGWIAHLDTALELTGEGVNPRIVESYDGGDIVLNREKNIVLSTKTFPDIKKYTGQDLIVTDGNTLLGSDDKAGIAEIMAALEYLVAHPEFPHGKILVGFNPDEEIGRGAHLFPLERFAADFAYTMDGGEIGELQYENFNAARPVVTIQGRSVHPGSAKDAMVNASLVAMEFNALLPASERPAHTSNYEGFFHLEKMSGEVDKATLIYLIRDHDKAKFAARKATFERCAAFINDRYGAGTVEIFMEEQYQNMHELILPIRHIVDTARQALEELGIKPLIIPIRGGTDGAQLTYKGLPTPNIFAGGHNLHGRYEYVPIPSMEKAVQVILKVIELYAVRSQ
jgi:tripeptide aminopeptidase